MAKLLTHHDKFHVHACLGILALLHFGYRFWCMFAKGQHSFTADATSLAALSIHFLLHVTSFQFVLPKQRQFSKPMIWKEFRVHNAIFAYRHLLCCVLGIYFPSWWYQMSVSSMLVKVGIVLLACKAAAVTTEQIGSTEKRTTNAMPYPEWVSSSQQETAKRFYAKSQFAATALAIFGTPMLSFGSILAIEIASVLMTLVRKGLIESWVYHAVYGAALFIMFPALLTGLHNGDEQVEQIAFTAMTCTTIAVTVRMQVGLSTYLTWVVAVLGTPISEYVSTYFLHFKVIAWVGMFSSVADTLLQLAKSGEDVAPRSTNAANKDTQKLPYFKTLLRRLGLAF